MTRTHGKPWLVAELFVLMIGLPALLYWVLPYRYMLPLIWLAAFYAYGMTRFALPESLTTWWIRTAFTRANLKPIILRFLLSAALLTLATWYFRPDLLFNFVLEKPAFWLVVMLAYPVLSVVPQEIIFRSFFFDRYRSLFPNAWAMIVTSGVCFGLAHILFNNWIAPTLCLIGGVMFAHTYHKTRSLLLVSFEHALYGDFLFTVGLGRYFYHGSVAAAVQ